MNRVTCNPLAMTSAPEIAVSVALYYGKDSEHGG